PGVDARSLRPKCAPMWTWASIRPGSTVSCDKSYLPRALPLSILAMRVPSMPMTTLRWMPPRPSMSVPARMVVCCAVATAGAQSRAALRRPRILASMRMGFLLVFPERCASSCSALIHHCGFVPYAIKKYAAAGRVEDPLHLTDEFPLCLGQVVANGLVVFTVLAIKSLQAIVGVDRTVEQFVSVPAITKLLIGAVIINHCVGKEPPSTIDHRRDRNLQTMSAVKKRFAGHLLGIEIAQVFCFGKRVGQLISPFLKVLEILQLRGHDLEFQIPSSEPKRGDHGAERNRRA